MVMILESQNCMTVDQSNYWSGFLGLAWRGIYIISSGLSKGPSDDDIIGQDKTKEAYQMFLIINFQIPPAVGMQQLELGIKGPPIVEFVL